MYYQLALTHRVLDEVTLEAADTITWDEDGNAELPTTFSQPLDDNATNVWAPYNTLAHNWTVSGEDKYLKRHQLLDEEGEVADLHSLHICKQMKTGSVLKHLMF